MSQLFGSILNPIFEEFAFIGNEIMKYKNRRWAKKQKSLMIKQIGVLFFSIVTASVIVAYLPKPDRHVPIKHIDLKDLPNFLSGFLRIFSIFGSFDRFITNLQLRLGIVYDIIIFLPSVIFNFIRFVLLSLYLLFSKISLNISQIFAYPALILEKIFSGFIQIPGISHLLTLFTYIIQDLVFLVSAFFALLRQIGNKLYEIDLSQYKWFDWILFLPRIILKLLSQIFEITLLPILKFLKLDFVFQFIFGKLSGFFNGFMFYLLKFAGFFSGFFNYIALHLHKLSFNFRFDSFKSIAIFFSGLFRFLGNIVMYPIYLFTQFLEAIYYFCQRFNVEFTRWWDGLCDCGNGDCNTYELLFNLTSQAREILEELRKKQNA